MTPLKGCTKPRISTLPLRPLNRRTSEGYAVIEFAEKTLGLTLMPWQKWLLIHAMELMPDGSLRFRYVLVLVARQNGKSLIGIVLSLYWLYRRNRRLVLGMSTTAEYAKQAWQNAVDLVLDVGLPTKTITTANGQVKLVAPSGCQYRIAAANRSAGRSLTVHNLLIDELREHRDFDAWNAASNAMNAVADAQGWCLSNAGDAKAVVLRQFHDAALSGASPQWGIFEWSAPDDCALDDRKGWAQANPALGHGTLTEAVIEGAMVGPPGDFRTEVLCQSVASLDSPIDLEAWAAGADTGGTLSVRDRSTCAFIDVSIDEQHVTLAAAGLLSDGRPRVEVVAAWGSVQEAREALPGLLEALRPRAFGWFAGSVLATDLAGTRRGQEIKGSDITMACAGLAEQVKSRRLLHSDDPLLTAQITNAGRLKVGAGWRFTGGPGGYVDAAYAAAGAVHLARTANKNAVGKVRILLPRAS